MNKTVKRLMTTSAIAFVFAGFGQNASAQEVSDENDEQVETQQAGEFALETIVVTARRRQENLQAVPVAVTGYSAQSLENKLIGTTEDLAFHTPSLQVSSGSQGGTSSQFFIRGVGQLDFISTLDPGVGVYLDGVYISRTAGSLLDLANVERLEVLRGPQGTLFGKNTIGGAINVVTKRAEDEFSGSGSISKGSRNRTNIKGNVNLPISDNVRTSFAFSSRQQDGFGRRIIPNLDPVSADVQPILGETKTGDENSSVFFGTVEWDAKENFTVKLSGDISRVREKGDHYVLQAINLDPGTLPDVSNNFVRNNLDADRIPFEIYDERYITGDPSLASYDPYTTYAGNVAGNSTDVFGISLQSTLGLTDDVNFKTIFAYRDLQTDTGVDFDVSPIEFFDQTVSLKQQQYSAEFQLDGTSLDGRFKWLVGAFVMKEEIDSNIRLNLSHGEDFVDYPYDVIERNPIDITSLALFSQASYSVTDNLSITGGLRLTQDKKVLSYSHELAKLPGEFLFEPGFGVLDETWSDISPKVSAEYITDGGTLFYGSVSKGFKSGAFNGRAFSAEDTIPATPETVWSYEVGAKMDLLDDKLRLNVALFRSEYNDIQTTICKDSGVCIVTNAAKAHIQGLELEGTFFPVERLGINVAVSILNDAYDNLDRAEGNIPVGADLIQTPDYTITLGAFFQVTDNLVARVDYFRTDDFYHNPGNGAYDFEPAYDLVNARITYTSEDDDWSLSVYGLNLTNTVYAQYREDLTGFGTSEAFIGKPREIGAELKFNF